MIPLPSARSHHIAAWSPDGQRIAAGGSVAMPRTWTSVAGSIVVFDAATGDELQSLVGHDNEIKAVAWSPDAARVVTVAAENNKAYVWDVPPLDRLVALARTRVFRQLTDEERRRFGLPEKPAEPSDTK